MPNNKHSCGYIKLRHGGNLLIACLSMAYMQTYTRNSGQFKKVPESL